MTTKTTWPCGHPKQKDLFDSTFPCPQCSSSEYFETWSVDPETQEAFEAGVHLDCFTTKRRWIRRGSRWEFLEVVDSPQSND